MNDVQMMIDELFKEHKLDKYWIASKVGVSDSAIMHWHSGRTGCTSKNRAKLEALYNDVTRKAKAKASGYLQMPLGQGFPKPKAPEARKGYTPIPEPIRSQVVSRLRYARKLAYVHEADASKHIGIPSNRFQALENGDADLTYEIMFKLCNLYNANPCYILTNIECEHNCEDEQAEQGDYEMAYVLLDLIDPESVDPRIAKAIRIAKQVLSNEG